MPAVPTRLPRRSRTDRTPDFVVAITEVSGRCTSAATATTGSPCLRARKTSGSYEIARSVRPAATCLIGAEGSEGTRGRTSSPTSRK